MVEQILYKSFAAKASRTKLSPSLFLKKRSIRNDNDFSVVGYRDNY